jgi:WD40-like Beta Propeller Repeat
MTDELFEQRIRNWYRQEVGGDTVAPDALHAAVADIPARRPAGVMPTFRRNFTLLAAAALIAVVSVVGALVAGSAITHLRSQATPAPSAPAAVAPPTATPSPTPSPTPIPSPTASPVVLPDSLIAVYHGLGDTAEILLLDPVTGDQVVLGTADVDGVQLRSGTYGKVEWSSDRRLVTVSRFLDGPVAQAQFDAITSTMTPIAIRFKGYMSPQGDRLAGIDGPPYGLIVSDLAGKTLDHVDLPTGGAFISRITWMPDGSAVVLTGIGPIQTATAGSNAFAATFGPPGWLFIATLDGSPLRMIARRGGGGFGDVAVSPEAATILATTDCTGTCPDGPGIASIDVASGTPSLLTHNPNDFTPTWSPDGGRIAFERTAGSARGIWFMDADGSNPTRLTSPTRPNLDYGLAWSPDGASILFSRGDRSQGGLGDLYVVPSTGGDAHLLLTNSVGDW